MLFNQNILWVLHMNIILHDPIWEFIHSHIVEKAKLTAQHKAS